MDDRITAERNREGAWILSAMVREDGITYYATQRTYGYTRREAGDLFVSQYGHVMLTWEEMD